MRMSQREAAAAIGVQESTISRWENGASVPQTGTFERMLEAYGLVPKFEDLGAEVEALRRRVDDLEAAARVNARGEAAAGRVEQGGAPPTDDADSPPEGAAPGI